MDELAPAFVSQSANTCGGCCERTELGLRSRGSYHDLRADRPFPCVQAGFRPGRHRDRGRAGGDLSRRTDGQAERARPLGEGQRRQLSQARHQPRLPGLPSGQGPGRRWAALWSAQEGAMDLYVILRRSGWQSPAELQEAADRSTQVGNDEMADEVRWIRSYVLNEDEGSVGTVCIYEAVSPEALRKHASLADLPADEIIPVADTVIVRDDP